MAKKTVTLLLSLLLCVVCVVNSDKLLPEKDSGLMAEEVVPKKDMYAAWLEINTIEELLEGPEGAKDLLDAESQLLECGEQFKKMLQACEAEHYSDWDAFAEVFTARNRAILNYIDALKKYEQSEKVQEYQVLLKKYQ